MAPKVDLRKTARGQECMIRIPGVCNHNPETTVLAHLPSLSIGAKAIDIHASFACSDCHNEVDRRTTVIHNKTVARRYHLDGVIRTQEWWVREGYLKW